MDTVKVMSTIKISIQQMVKNTLANIDYLNANNIALTIIALVLYQGNKKSIQIERLYEKLLEKQLPNGSWNEELWATGLALLAQFKYFEHRGRKLDLRSPSVKKAFGYILGTKNEKRFNWQGEFLETILLCWIMLTIGNKSEYIFIKNSLQRLIEMQNKEGFFFDIYDTAFMVLALHEAKKTIDFEYSDTIHKGVSWLCKCDLDDENIWTCSIILFTLSNIDNLIECDTKEMAKTLHNLFDQGIISSDHDEQAMSIAALCSFLNKYYSKSLQTQTEVSGMNLRAIPN